MTRKRLDSIVDGIINAVAAGHGLNTTPEQKGGELGDVMALVGRVLKTCGPSIVRQTKPTLPTSLDGVDCGPKVVAEPELPADES